MLTKDTSKIHGTASADNGKQIVSAKWIEEMLTPCTIESGRFQGMHYGYLWWIVHPERNIYAAIGNSGNIIYVDPNRNLAAAVSSYFKPTIQDRVDSWGQKAVRFYDPDGNLIEVGTPV